MQLNRDIQDPFYKGVFDILAKDQVGITGDEVVSHKLSTIEEMKQFEYTEVQARYASNGINCRSIDDVRKDMVQIVGDSFMNPVTGIGTLGDPNTYSRGTTPVMLGPTESSGVYASGGLAQIITDKKSRGLVGQGVTFKSIGDDDFWTPERRNKLEDAAVSTKLNGAMGDALRDSNIFGGSILYPVFNTDMPLSFSLNLEAMNLGKNCISRWISVDRWNTTFVPSFIVTAEDYLNPKEIYVPLGGYAVSRTRCAILRPKPMPYWSTLCNIGWSPSDFCGYLRALFGYEMIILAVPTMAQQMSLLLYQMPMDGLNATIGHEEVKKLMKINEDQMKEWSVLHPKAVNMVGELQVVNRTFTGFDDFVGAAKSALAAESGIPEPILFHTPNKGFSDNTQESLMKESDTVKAMQSYIEPQLGPISFALIAHTFGMDSEEWKHRNTIALVFDHPTQSTDKEKAEIAARFAATVSSLSQAGVPTHVSIDLAKQFFPTVQLTDDLVADIKTEEKRRDDLEAKGVQMKQTGGPGHTMASSGSADNTGTFTKSR